MYLLIRCSPLLEQSELALAIIMITGAVTAFFAASVGLFQNDIKKIIAYSTMSQLAREYNKFIIFRNRTIYEKLMKIKIGNSQITKARNYSIYNYNNNNFFNSFRLIKDYKMKDINKYLVESSKMVLNISNLPGPFFFSRGIFDEILKTNPTMTKGNEVKKDSIYELTNLKHKLNPYYITGFIDGEGCFLINVRPKPKMKIGYSIELVFKVCVHVKDKILIESIKYYFGVGTVTMRGNNYIQYWVSSIKELVPCVRKDARDLDKNDVYVRHSNLVSSPPPKEGVRDQGLEESPKGLSSNLEVIINHFDNYPLITEKWFDYICWSSVFKLIKNKEHLTRDGFDKILKYKSSINKGSKDWLKETCFNNKPFLTSLHYKKVIKNPNWVTGFIEAEGCFMVCFTKGTTKLGKVVQLKFLVTQHDRDKFLLKSLIQYFGCGQYNKRASNYLASDYIVTKFKDINEKIISFFDQYVLLGTKSKDLMDFKEIAELIKNKSHLTKEGIKKISYIKSRMNKGRVLISKDNVIKRPLNSQTNKFSLNLESLSKNKRYYSTSSIFDTEYINNKNDKNKFCEWLGGLIDADGSFHYTKKGFGSLKIIMNIDDKSALFEIKHKYGGSIKPIAGFNGLKYKLQYTKGLINLINDVNGLIRNPIRLLQLNKICVKYDIKLKEPLNLIYNNGWFSGFIDGDGSIYIDEKTGQLIISVTQRNKYLLDPLIKLYSGRINIIKSKEAFQYSIYRKEEILNLVDNYFNNYPLKSGKVYKLNLIKNFYNCKDYRYLEINQLDKFNEWIKFKNQWDKI